MSKFLEFRKFHDTLHIKFIYEVFMKKLNILIIILMIAFLVSCEDRIKETIIRLNSPIPSEVERVHIAVLNGETVLTQNSFTAADENNDGTISIYVSPGEDRTIVLVAEDFNGSVITDIEAGRTSSVNLHIRKAVWTDSPADENENLLERYWSENRISWDSANIIKTRYIIEDNEAPYQIYYDGFDNQVDYQRFWDAFVNGINLIVEFYPFQLKTNKFFLEIAG